MNFFTLQGCFGRTAAQDPEWGFTYDVVFPEKEIGNWRVRQAVQVSDLQDKWEEGSVVHHGPLHELCVGSVSTDGQAGPTLGQERTGTSVSAGLLKLTLCHTDSCLYMCV